jgi:alpha-1,6-mannosyltransferase
VPDRHHLAAILASADVALNPAPIETFGLAALEALASGTPVVASRTSALVEIASGAAGQAVAPEPSALAVAVMSLLRRPIEGRRRAARRRAEEYPWSRTISAMLDVHGDRVSAWI